MRHRLALLVWLVALPAFAAPQLRKGDLLVTDSANARVLHVDPATGVVSDFSPRDGSGQSFLFQPAGIAIDPAGVVFVVDSFAEHVVAIDPTTGAQSVLNDYSILVGDFGPSDVGTAPKGIALEQTVAGLDGRDLFVASDDGLYRVHRDFDGTFSELLSGATELQLGNDVAVEEYLGEVYALWVVAYGALVRYDVGDGTVQTRTNTGARTMYGVDLFGGTILMTRDDGCGGASSFNGLFRWDGSFGEVKEEGTGWASCFHRAIAIASPTSVFASYGDTQIVELTPTIDGYAGESIATVPAGSVATVIADLAVSPVTFAPEPARSALAAVALAALAVRRRRST